MGKHRDLAILSDHVTYLNSCLWVLWRFFQIVFLFWKVTSCSFKQINGAFGRVSFQQQINAHLLSLFGGRTVCLGFPLNKIRQKLATEFKFCVSQLFLNLTSVAYFVTHLCQQCVSTLSEEFSAQFLSSSSHTGLIYPPYINLMLYPVYVLLLQFKT